MQCIYTAANKPKEKICLDHNTAFVNPMNWLISNFIIKEVQGRISIMRQHNQTFLLWQVAKM